MMSAACWECTSALLSAVGVWPTPSPGSLDQVSAYTTCIHDGWLFISELPPSLPPSHIDFMNPPGNLTCHAQTDAATGRAEVVLNWEPPELFTGRSADNFFIGYITQNEHINHGHFHSPSQAPLSTTIVLEDDGWYKFYVLSDGARNDAPALCLVYILDRSELRPSCRQK